MSLYYQAEKIREAEKDWWNNVTNYLMTRNITIMINPNTLIHFMVNLIFELIVDSVKLISKFYILVSIEYVE
jgi:hypothetical protein